MNITLKFNEGDVANVKAMLRGLDNIVPIVLSRSINDTLAGVKTDASAEIRTIITATKTVVDKAMKITKSAPTYLQGRVEISGTPLPLIAYSARQTLKGVSVQVRKDRGRKVIPGTFIATVRTAAQAAGGYEGHEGVFWRKWHAGTGKKGKNMGKKAWKKFGEGYRLPIEQKFGPRIPDIIENDPVMNAVLTKSDDRMHKNLDKELNYELSKL